MLNSSKSTCTQPCFRPPTPKSPQGGETPSPTTRQRYLHWWWMFNDSEDEGSALHWHPELMLKLERKTSPWLPREGMLKEEAPEEGAVRSPSRSTPQVGAGGWGPSSAPPAWQGAALTHSTPGICSDYRFPQMGFNTVWPSAAPKRTASHCKFSTKHLRPGCDGPSFFFLVHLDLTQPNARQLTVSKNNFLFIH